MQIWVDADACPSAIREIIAKAAHKRTITTTFVANHSFTKLTVRKALSSAIGFDEADKEIERRVTAGDLVITETYHCLRRPEKTSACADASGRTLHREQHQTAFADAGLHGNDAVIGRTNGWATRS